MRNKLITSLLILTASLSSSNAFSDGPGWTTPSTIHRIVVTINGGINVRLTHALSGCTPQSGYGANYAWLKDDHKGLNSIHSNLLAAYMSGKKVSLWLSDSTCRIGEISLGGSHSS